MSSTQGSSSVWTPANIVTCIRIVLIPVFMVLAIPVWDHIGPVPAAPAAFVVYVLLSLTDKVDGELARSRGEITDFGKFLDPIADKLLVFSALLILLEQGTVSVWAVFLILLREFLVSALRMVAGAHGKVIAADALGKWKTATTMVALCGFLLWRALGMSPAGIVVYWFSSITFALAVILTVISGIQYFLGSRDVVFRV
ncbi:CDP-diacylglycerol--glycerol-3-phosphate 3-phosphatidyltransferase [Collinsella sp. AGMB00827]|uniref:CDP-diacylglycerol--glycerol-3-phosphate 3-phosphatidyltransferase n=1 Tax=Collinsella ureilytica TaxID=2869515 RepID=A0ABS7MKU6_9ACTN|nr:CDP-diacylglycerol--glycerol-3-phosphate 3-phosphatidyltransferase [Collinsella urealyticum]MBY4797986.1 CDP-diacylglycerol--glycerol-3-phosphate 3-phosphatidyltransferase [Collinsella urealyticum]